MTMRPQALLIACALLLATDAAIAQDSTHSRPRLRGVVVDDSRVPVPGAEVFLEPRRQRTVTGTDGSFAFSGLEQDSVTIIVRRLGFKLITRSILVDTGETVVRVTMRRLMVELPMTEINAARTGVSGLVVDTANAPVVGAEVRIAPTGQTATSDSLGEFFIPLPAGAYMLRVWADGYAPRLLSLTVPADSSRRLLTRLAPGNVSRARVETHFEEFRERMLRRRLMWSNFYTSDDIAAHNWRSVHQIAEVGSGRTVGLACAATINGERWRERLVVIDLRNVEAVEVYAQRGIAESCPIVIVWLRTP